MELNNSPEFREMMLRIEASNAGQEKYAKKQYAMARISAAASILALVVVLVCALMIVPRALAIITDLETVTAEVSESLPEMIEDVHSLVESADEGISESFTKIEALDIDSLNEAIYDLQAIVEPLARMFGR